MSISIDFSAGYPVMNLGGTIRSFGRQQTYYTTSPYPPDPFSGYWWGYYAYAYGYRAGGPWTMAAMANGGTGKAYELAIGNLTQNTYAPGANFSGPVLFWSDASGVFYPLIGVGVYYKPSGTPDPTTYVACIAYPLLYAGSSGFPTNSIARSGAELIVTGSGSYSVYN